MSRGVLVKEIIKKHDAGKVDLVKQSPTDIAKKVGCAPSTAFRARDVLYKRDSIPKPKKKFELVIDAHKEGLIDLEHDVVDEMAEQMGMHKDVIRNAIRKAGIKRDVSYRSVDTVGERQEWYKRRKMLRLMDSWKCIPERVGLTKNQWLRRNEDRA